LSAQFFSSGQAMKAFGCGTMKVRKNARRTKKVNKRQSQRIFEFILSK